MLKQLLSKSSLPSTRSRPSSRWGLGQPVFGSLLMVVLALVLRGLGGLQVFEWRLLDTMLRWRPAEARDDRITLVTIDETDIQQAGHYPLSDRQLAQLLQQLNAYQPRAIGLDIFRDLPVEPGHSEFLTTLENLPNLVAIERILTAPVQAPGLLPAEQIGFVDIVRDSDGFFRRDLLGSPNAAGDYRFSLTIQLANLYFAPLGITLENGLRNPEAMRFDTVEFSPFRAQTGGYVRADAGGHQSLVYPRSGQQPFSQVTLRALRAGTVPASLLRDRVVLIGITAPSIKDTINTNAIAKAHTDWVFGVEFRAHALSQVLSAVLDDRPLLRAWPEGLEISWIVLWGLAGLGLGAGRRSPRRQLLAVGLGSCGLLGLGYGLLLRGLWIPVVPAGLAFGLNGLVLYAFYLYDRGLRDRIQNRQRVIEQTFDAIHNGPLQSLSQLIRRTEPLEDDLGGEASPRQNRQRQNFDPALHQALQHLNQELRQVYEQMRQEAVAHGTHFYLEGDQVVDANLPLHELLYEVYAATLARDFPGFAQLKFKVVKFLPLEEAQLTLERKQDIARFLEEALCNCGKYALGATRLTVTCRPENDRHVIQVQDNADPPLAKPQVSGGRGTQQAQRLARQLGGTFERVPLDPKGTSCTLSWPQQRFPRLPWSKLVTFVQRRSQNDASF